VSATPILKPTNTRASEKLRGIVERNEKSLVLIGAEGMNLKRKVVIITGGSSGIGYGTAKVFTREGAKVVIAARNAQRGEQAASEIRRSGGEISFVATDVSKSNEIEALVRATVERYGRLDCAVNNAAAYSGAFAFTADFSEEEFDQTMAVDLKGVWLGMKFQIKQMLAQDPPGGAIVNTSSVNGLGGSPMGSLYSAAKAGILGLTKSAAYEYGGKGIRVNALVAGAFDTPMLNNAIDKSTGGDPEAREKAVASFKAMVAAGRIGNPLEAGEVIGWLCSDAASYVTGHSMIADGGLSARFR
jgi:NAD(P)-dependent dehydrogenase (short-subunit alcohol dehydrogenase family)